MTKRERHEKIVADAKAKKAEARKVKAEARVKVQMEEDLQRWLKEAREYLSKNSWIRRQQA